jgi:hypothetical protein
MSQNQAVQTARAANGGVGFANLDGAGNLNTNSKNQIHVQVAASQTKAVLGATGAIGDAIYAITIVPATTSPGAVTLYDGSGSTGIVLFTGGATSVADLKPFQVTIQAKATTVANPGWFVTTGTNVSVMAVGNFT